MTNLISNAYHIKTSTTPLISICIPTYNRAMYLNAAISSALNQTDSFFEVVIVDDGSNDDTAFVIQKFNDHRINYIRKEHTNAPDTRNRCISESRGQFILWLDSDDILEPDLILKFRRKLSRFPEIDVCYGDIHPFGNLGSCPNNSMIYRDYYRKNRELLSEMVTGNKIPNPGTFIRKELFDRVGMYDIQYNRAHDYEFWIRSALEATFKHIEGISARWRWHEGNMSAGNKPLDTSYESSILSKLIQQHPIDTLFPFYDWNNKAFSSFLAHGEIAMMFLKWNNIFQYTAHLKKAVSAIYSKIELTDNNNLQLKILSKFYIEFYNKTKIVYFKNMAQISLTISNMQHNHTL